MSKTVKAGLLDAFGILFALTIPIGTIYYNFRGEVVADMAWYEKFGLGAGAAGLIIMIAIITLWKYIAPKIKTNPDLWAINLFLAWSIFNGILFLINAVISQLFAVAISGMIAGFIACLFNVAAYCVKHYGKEK